MEMLDLKELDARDVESAHENGQRGEILFYFILFILPRVQRRLKHWRKEAGLCNDNVLRQQALASLANKAFHCQGGAVFALAFPNSESVLLPLIVAYQTICDYLDNLCDRCGSTDGESFEQLHLALLDALTPGKQYADYYKYYRFKDDGEYLKKLVNECRACIEKLPGYDRVYQEIIKLADRYIQLQVKKHIDINCREAVLKEWVFENLADYPGLMWQEFAAACGSTLAIFALFGLASCENPDNTLLRKISAAYFPWICGLHILLDYFIDRQEDEEGGDLNFTFYYREQPEMIQRLKLFVNEGHRCARQIPDNRFHETVVQGLLALYLSDSKVKKQGYEDTARLLLTQSGPKTIKTYRLCQLLRKIL